MSLDAIFVVNRIKLMPPVEREAKLRELLGRFPDDWLPLADAILHEELTKRKQSDQKVLPAWWGGRQ